MSQPNTAKPGETQPIKTLCPYCGVGCGLEVVPTGAASDSAKPAYKVRGDRSHPSSKGMVCVKGATILDSLDKDRLLYPMMRDSLDEPFRQVSWEDAARRITDEIQTAVQTRGADSNLHVRVGPVPDGRLLHRPKADEGAAWAPTILMPIPVCVCLRRWRAICRVWGRMVPPPATTI